MDQEALIARIAARVREELEAQARQQAVPPLPEVRGTWKDTSALRLALGEVDRVGTDGGLPDAARLGASAPAALAKIIDHTLLKPDATRKDLVKLCEEARAHSFFSVCINTTWVPLAVELLKGCTTKVICVVGFPLGAATPAAKAAETREAIKNGAAEIDMVINIGRLKGGEHEAVYEDIRAVVEAASGRPVKVILETHMLSRDEKIIACTLSKAAGAAFVKTATGFSGGGATAEDIALMRAVVGPSMGVKASGGVRSAADVQKMVAAGADRVGASASVAIVSGSAGKGGY